MSSPDALSAQPAPGPQKGARSALAFVFLTVLIDSIGFGIIIPVLPELVMELTGEGLSEASRIGGYLLFVYATMQFFFAPIIGNLSDRFGRRPVLLFSLLAFSLDYLLMGLAPTLGWLFVGRMIAGIAGSSYSTANAYIADVTPPEQRGQNFGMIGAAFGIGFIIGPVLGGFLGEFGARAPFFAAAALGFANTMYGFFVMKESLPPAKRRPFEWSRANALGALGQVRKRPMMIGLVLAVFVYSIGHHVYPSTWSYFTMERFSFSERQVGYSLGFVGVIMAFSQGFLIRKVIPRFGLERTAKIGFGFAALAYLGCALAPSPLLLYLALIPSGLGGLTTPALRSLMANQTPDNEQGELQGALASVESIASIAGPLLMTQLFGAFTVSKAMPSYFPGAPYVAATALTLLAALFFLMSLRRVRV